MSDSNASTTAAPPGQSGDKKKEFGEGVPRLIAVISSLLYASGFVVWTGYLGANGIYEQSLVSAKYILSGGLVSLIAGVYYFWVWRKMAARFVEMPQGPAPNSPVLRQFLFVYFIVEDIFCCAVTASALTGMFVTSIYVDPVAVPGITLAVVDSLLFQSKLVRQHFRLALATSFLLVCLYLIWFFVYGAFNPPLVSFAVVLVTITWVGFFIRSLGPNKEDAVYSAFYLGLMATISVATFGATVFGYIDPRFGGAQPSRVSVVLAGDAGPEIREAFENAGLNLHLIIEDDHASVFRLRDQGYEARIVRLDKDLIRAVFYFPPPTKAAAEARFAAEFRRFVGQSIPPDP
jgi:hypothetical protein